MSIKATILADSINTMSGQRITTFMVEYPRIIMAEFNTHKMVEKNHSSSRAIPIDSVIEQLQEEHFIPELWGINKSGMSSDDYYLPDSAEANACTTEWEKAFKNAVKSAKKLKELGVHKQWCNRLLEPFQYVRGICTATDFDNFFRLRCAPDAQPEINKLAMLMREAYENSNPVSLKFEEYHIPFFRLIEDGARNKYKIIDDFVEGQEQVIYDYATALNISVSLCAQVSYRKSDMSVEKAVSINDKLWTAHHYSPFGHQATPIDPELGFNQVGVTHLTKGGYFGSGNLSGFVSYRHMLAGLNNTTPDFRNYFHS